MRFFVLPLLFIMICASLQSQERDFSRVDATAIFYPIGIATTQDLTLRIKTDFSHPEDQLRAAYTWIIHNIAYEPDEYLTYKFQYRILEERNEKLVSTREEIIERTMIGKKAVCEGYALVLERICEQLDIKAYVVRGDVKRDVVDIGRPFNKNHMWIIAMINEKPIIMDPTWGAGKYIESFKREPSYNYYDVNPDHFIKTHYPEVFDDAYTNKVINRVTFSSWPLIVSSELDLQDISPSLGIIKYKDLKNGIDFKVRFKPQKTLLYTFDDGVMREIKGTQKGKDIAFNIRSKNRTTRLIIYDGTQPLIAYLVK